MLRFTFVIVLCIALLVLGWGRLWRTPPGEMRSAKSAEMAAPDRVTGSQKVRSRAIPEERDYAFAEFARPLVAASALPVSLDMQALEQRSAAFRTDSALSLSARVDLKAYFASLGPEQIAHAMSLSSLCQLDIFDSEAAYLNVMDDVSNKELDTVVAPFLTCDAFRSFDLGKPVTWLDALEAMGQQGDWFARSIYWMTLKEFAASNLDYVKQYPEAYGRRRDLAMRWLLQLAAYGHSRSVVHAALAYQFGFLVPEDASKAYFIAYRGQYVHGLNSSSIDYLVDSAMESITPEERLEVEKRVHALVDD